MKSKKHIYFIIVIFTFFIKCSQGSVGNSLTEKNFVLQRYIIIMNTNTSPVKIILYIFDDRGDNNLNQFQIISNSITYTLNILNPSSLNLESYSLYLAKSGDFFAKNSLKHLGENTVPEISSNTTSLTERYYINSSSTSLNFFSLNSSSDLLGSYYKQELSGIQIPRGSITKGIFTFKPSIQLSINSGSSLSINYPSSISFAISFNCPILHNGISDSILSIGIKYSDIFKDNGSSKPISESLGGTININSYISSFSNSNFVSQYECIKK